MEIVRTIAAYRQARSGLPGPVGLVATLGGVHEGHLSLARAARRDCASVVGWLFLNPTQFGAGEDLDRYPRDEERDRSLLAENGVDLLLIPDGAVVYPPGFDALVRIGGITDRLEGARRPGHFDGVATVVLKLLNIMQTDRAYFGEKDAQQLRVVRQLVRDLNLPCEIVSCPTVRDPDGLALSSRNAYLTPDERRRALAIPSGLRRAEAAFELGERGAQRLRQLVSDELDATSGLRVDYVSLADDDTLDELEGVIEPPALLSVAVHVGMTHLIDNVTLGGPAS